MGVCCSIDNWELHLAQVIEMVQYSVPNQNRSSEEISFAFIRFKSAVINEGIWLLAGLIARLLQINRRMF